MVVSGANACVGSLRYGYLLGGTKKDCNCNEGDSERDESTEEQLQCKQQYLCTPHGTLSPPSPSQRLCGLCTESMPETTETSNANMRYPK